MSLHDGTRSGEHLMAIEYQIDHARRIVFATGLGTLTEQDIFGYQREVWSRNDVAGYDELIDMCAVERIADPSVNRIMELADLSAEMDTKTVASRFASVAPDSLAFGLGRMYQAFRETNPRSNKSVAVFHTRAEALDWLGIK